MNEFSRSLKWSSENSKEPQTLLNREWLISNGLGGYASGTISGVNTRRYHGLLISALASPLGRVIMLNQMTETLVFPGGERVQLTGEEMTSCALQMQGNCYLTEFSLEKGLPVFRYDVKGLVLEKRLFMRYQQNTIQISWKMIAGQTPVILELRPAVHFRPHGAYVDIFSVNQYITTVAPDYYELSSNSEFPPLKMLFNGTEVTFSMSGLRTEAYIYREEGNQGYPNLADLWSPGYFRATLTPGTELVLVASTHSLDTIRALSPSEALKAENERRLILLSSCHPLASHGQASELVLAADQFIISPAGRREDTIRIKATGGDIRTVIAGYHWFTDWGRDTMISLEGLALLTGRYSEASWILHTFSHYIRRGLIPNVFPEAQKEGVYNTADATLWFFHALDRYLQYSGDKTTLKLLLKDLLEIIDWHIKGTDFGIGVDPADGLLRQGAEGHALTWMDAKVGEWVVTPRRGKAVEINALWYNALRLLEGWVRSEMGDSQAQSLAERAALVRKSFNRRFWYAEGGYLYDVVDGEKGDDTACRPNQLLAISLHFPVLKRSLWQPVTDVASERLLTAVGLRSLSPDHPEYKSKYFGDIRDRDAAYHQGTVWAWLIGPYIDAWLKVHPNRQTEARHFLDGLLSNLNDAGIGSISEIFDAGKPFTPRGCIAQAWSVAEVLRCWVKTSQSGQNTDVFEGVEHD